VHGARQRLVGKAAAISCRILADRRPLGTAAAIRFFEGLGCHYIMTDARPTSGFARHGKISDQVSATPTANFERLPGSLVGGQLGPRRVVASAAPQSGRLRLRCLLSIDAPVFVA
jgi:hypothetical protein